jgi:hypothetical protein
MVLRRHCPQKVERLGLGMTTRIFLAHSFTLDRLNEREGIYLMLVKCSCPAFEGPRHVIVFFDLSNFRRLFWVMRRPELPPSLPKASLPFQEIPAQTFER